VQQNNIITGTCNAGNPLSQTAQFPIDVVVGPEFVTGSSRMKAGTAKISVKHDFDRHNDTTRQSERKQNGRHATK
jgi:hypothetical protein